MPTVSDTSPIFNLACIGRLELLQEQFSRVWIPGAVEAELMNAPNDVVRKTIDDAKQGAGSSRSWFQIRSW